MDGHPCRVIENAAFVVDAEAAPQNKGVSIVGMGPPRALAGRKVGARHGCIVTARPSPESNLRRERPEAQQGNPVRGSHSGSLAPAYTRTAGDPASPGLPGQRNPQP